MQLDLQVCSLKLAQKLKALGVPQDSLFCWDTAHNEIHLREDAEGLLEDSLLLSAFTVAELGHLLPHETISYFDLAGLWQCKYPHDSKHIKGEVSEADARAKMLIYLLEHGKHSLTEEHPIWKTIQELESKDHQSKTNNP